VLFACWRIATVSLVALTMGASFSHVLELPGKLTLSADQYLLVQTIYRSFGPVASVLEPVCIALVIGLAVLSHHRAARPGSIVPRSAVRWTAAAAALLIAALITWIAVVSPMNREMAAWAGAAPAAWTGARDRWEWGHVAVFGLKLAALVLLLLPWLAEHDDDDTDAVPP
jgi:hypothetical protein